MNADSIEFLTESVLGAVMEVSNRLGAGFLERVYQPALLRELCLRGIRATSWMPPDLSIHFLDAALASGHRVASIGQSCLAS